MTFNFSDSQQEIEILAAGSHTSNSGTAVSLSPDDLQEIADSYNPANFRAPLIVTSPAHSVPTSDREAHAAEFAYGTPDRLKVVGGKLKAVFSKISPKFQEWVRGGQILNVSSSIYPRSHPGNPNPGRLSLRHIAGLGATPPAIKQLAPIALSEWDQYDPAVDDAIAFSDFELSPDSDLLEFGCAACERKGKMLSELFTGIREWIISSSGLETADKILPKYLIEAIEDEFESEGMLEEPYSGPMSYSEEDEMSHQMKEELERRAKQLDAREAALRRSEFESFCEQKLPGKITPAIASFSELVDFMEFLSTRVDTISFGEAEEVTPLEWFQGFLEKLQPQISFGEYATGEIPGDRSSAQEAENRAAQYYLEMSKV